ncbi:MAG: flagellar export chaperone FliS [Bacillota bacterium]|jgi:flagellar protein FliS
MSYASAGYLNPQAVYKQNAVETAPPEKLLIMLYSGAIKFLHQGQQGLREKNYEEAHNNLVKVQNIIMELSTTLNMEQGGEIAVNLRRLYDFYYQETVQANIKKDPALLDPVLEFFRIFRDVWIETARLNRTGAK